MDWQEAMTLGLVALSALWLAGKGWRRWRRGSATGLCGCAGGACGARRPMILRGRKGASPQQLPGRSGTALSAEERRLVALRSD